MPKKSTFQPYKFKSTELQRQRLVVKDFLGADFSPSQISVANYNAVDMQNVVFRDGLDRKRKGFEQMLQVPETKYVIKSAEGYSTERTNTYKVNGVWNFIAEDGKEYVIAHVGKLLYNVKGLGNENSFLDVTINPIFYANSNNVSNLAIELRDDYSMAFTGDKKLYILDGNKYFVLRANNDVFTLTPVEEDSETFVPTTTIGITYADSRINERTALDDVNLMTQWRQNKLVSGTYIDDGVTLRTTRFWDYELDTSIAPKNFDDLKDVVVTVDRLKKGA